MRSDGEGALLRLAILAALVLLAPGMAHAAKQPRDLAHFAACTIRSPGTDLDPQETISTGHCAEDQRPDTTPPGMSSLKVRAAVGFGRKKVEGATWNGLLVLNVSYQRVETRFGGNATAGFARYKTVTVMLGGQLRELPLKNDGQNLRKCLRRGRGAWSTSICLYSESGAIMLTPELVALFRQAANPSDAVIKIKLFSADGEDFTMDFSPAEVVAAADLIPG
jgi:hypothetical protein